MILERPPYVRTCGNIDGGLMRELTLLRVGSSHYGTFGVLRDGHVPFALTLEQPWRDNRPNESCIPAGSYVCRRVQSPKFGNTFEVTNVPGRSHILFHRGNFIEDTYGCILVGESFTYLNHLPGIGQSTQGFAEFLSLLDSLDSFALHLHDWTPVV